MVKSKTQTIGAKIDGRVKDRIVNALDSFKASSEEEYKFVDNFSNLERAFVHTLSVKMGLKSKSYGKGKQRRVSVFKPKRKSKEGGKRFPSLTFSNEAREILQDLFVNYPPDEEDKVMERINMSRAGKKSHRRGSDDVFFRPILKEADIAKKVESLALRLESTAKLRKIADERSKLPIWSFKDEIASTVASHQVVLISGETGCGKTTQVPQFLLDYIWGKGETCKIVCTQPRRISATSVAERIAAERGEDIGGDIGYKIRLEKKGGRHSSVVFCTNGILLRVLVAKGVGTEASQKTKHDEISEITHIIMDEIHERDCFSDFMLAIIRDFLPLYPHLRLILMSATLEAERFSQYFGGCPIICVPGFTYPVKTFYLEDVLSLLSKKDNNHLDNTIPHGTIEESELTKEDMLELDEAIDLAWSNDDFESLNELVSSEGTRKVYDYQHSQSGLTSLMVFASKGRVGEVCMLLSFGADCKLRSKDGASALELAAEKGHEAIVKVLKKHIAGAPLDPQEEQELLNKYLANVNPEIIDVVLIEKLLLKICTDSADGAVLVFLPGWDVISKTRDKLLTNHLFKDESKFYILALHSMIPSIEQKKVFQRPPRGCRKIILSTNIAETAVTIDDVVFVIDSGRLKEKSYDPISNESTLKTSWVCKASAKQREGRAGRCQPGICYHLFSKLQAASSPEFQLPEIRRMPMEELCLQVKLLNPDCRIEEFLYKTLDPPLPETIKNAIIILEDIGALSAGEQLTELGEKLGALPLHPVTSKMLLFAMLMNCLDPALTIACAFDYKDPFLLPMVFDDRVKINEAKRKLSSLLGGYSDQLAVVAAFDCWTSAKAKGLGARFCTEYFISPSTLRMLARMRKQLQDELVRSGLISQNVSDYSMNARNPGILHAVLAAGVYPKVGRLLPLTRQKSHTAVETASSNKVRIHPQSVNSRISVKDTDSPLVVYDEIIRGDYGSVIKTCTIVGPLPLMFLSTELAAAPANDEDNDSGSDNGESDEDVGAERAGKKLMSSPDNSVVVVLDRWLYFSSTALDVAQIYLLRERLSAAILFTVKYPKEILPPVLGVTVYAIACILSFDGLRGIVLPGRPADSETSRINAIDAGESKHLMSQTTDVFLRSLFTNSAHCSSNLEAKPSNGTRGLNGGRGSTPNKRKGFGSPP